MDKDIMRQGAILFKLLLDKTNKNKPTRTKHLLQIPPERRVSGMPHPLQKLQKMQVNQWMAEMDRLALEFARLPVVQFGTRGQNLDEEFVCQSTNSAPNTARQFPFPRLFRSLALCSPHAPGQPVKFYSQGFRLSSNGLQVEACQYLNRACEDDGDSSLLTDMGNDGRPHFLLQLIKSLFDVKTGKQVWILACSVDITDAVREAAIEHASKPHDIIAESEQVRGRRNAITESQISAEDVYWLDLIIQKAAKKDEAEQSASALLPSSPSTRSSSSLSTTVSANTDIFPPSLSSSSSSPKGLPASSTLVMLSEQSRSPVTALLSLIKEIRDVHQIYFLLSPPTLPLRHRPSPKYEFLEYQITHLCPSLYGKERCLPPPTSLSYTYSNLPAIDKVISSPREGRPTSPPASSTRTQYATFPPSSPRHADMSSPFSPPPSAYYTAPSSPAPFSPMPTSPVSPPLQLTPSTLFQHTASSTINSISDSMAAGKPFRAYVMFRTPYPHPQASANSAGRTPWHAGECGDGEEERSVGKWLYGVPMGDGREGVVGCWVCWVLDSGVEDDVMGVEEKD
ncbi:MAG: hypothetical protein Q9165_004333 [Trypethelium subeluteriae]